MRYFGKIGNFMSLNGLAEIVLKRFIFSTHTSSLSIFHSRIFILNFKTSKKYLH
jgi:hypothetical protein